MGALDDAARLVELERQAVMPAPVNVSGFNSQAVIPYGLTTSHLQAPMHEFLNFLYNWDPARAWATYGRALLMRAAPRSGTIRMCALAGRGHPPRAEAR